VLRPGVPAGTPGHPAESAWLGVPPGLAGTWHVWLWIFGWWGAVSLAVTDLREFRGRMEFYDIAAVVHFLHKVIWIVPEFTVEAYRDRLRSLHDRIETGGPFTATSVRFLIEARKPPRP
jgi:hypothetical protein